jgi:hypothetical protein
MGHYYRFKRGDPVVIVSGRQDLPDLSALPPAQVTNITLGPVFGGQVKLTAFVNGTTMTLTKNGEVLGSGHGTPGPGVMLVTWAGERGEKCQRRSMHQSSSLGYRSPAPEEAPTLWGPHAKRRHPVP